MRSAALLLALTAAIGACSGSPSQTADVLPSSGATPSVPTSAQQAPTVQPASPSPTAPVPSATPSPPVAEGPRIALDRNVVDLGQKFAYCFEGYGTVSAYERLSVVYPNGTERTDGWARVYPNGDVRCRSFSFDPTTPPWPQGAYTFNWRVNAAPASFTVTLRGDLAAAQATPAPARTLEPSLAPAPAPTPAPPVAPPTTAPAPCSPQVGSQALSGQFVTAVVKVGQRYSISFLCFPEGTRIRWSGTTWPSGQFVPKTQAYVVTVSTEHVPSGAASILLTFEPSINWAAGTYLERFVTDQGVVYDVKVTLVR